MVTATGTIWALSLSDYPGCKTIQEADKAAAEYVKRQADEGSEFHRQILLRHIEAKLKE
jgi:hypothetical protein